MKVAGLSGAGKSGPSLPKVFSDSPPKNEIWGKTFEGEQELYDLWDSNQIDSYCSSFINDKYEEPYDPHIGLTERERNRAVLGHTHIADVKRDERRYSLGQTQPTSKGRRILESNVQALRAKYGNP